MTAQVSIALLDELASVYPWLLPLCFGMAGACIGSFLNVVIYRSPRGLSLSEPPRSFCPKCGKMIHWYNNIPLLSWPVLRGRCADCGEKIPFRYWAVEAVTALLFAAVAFEFGMECMPTQILLCAWVALAIAVFCIDMETMLVLPIMTLAAAVCGIGAVALSPWLIASDCYYAGDAALSSLCGAFCGFILLKATAFAGRVMFGSKRTIFSTAEPWMLRPSDDEEDIILQVKGDEWRWSDLFAEERNRLILKNATLYIDGKERAHGCLAFEESSVESDTGAVFNLEEIDGAQGVCTEIEWRREVMGTGDAWIALAIGALCGWQGVVFSLAAGSVIGIVAGLVRGIRRGEPMPFGPCIMTAALIWLFFGHTWWTYYLNWAEQL